MKLLLLILLVGVVSCAPREGTGHSYAEVCIDGKLFYSTQSNNLAGPVGECKL